MTLDTIVFESHELALQHFFDQGWTDGLPIVPPTTTLVAEVLAAGGREPEELLGTVDERRFSLSVGQAATCAVMAGCAPAYFPVVLATWTAAFDPRFNLHSVLSSTGGAAICGVVSGPYAAEIGMNSRTNLFGTGNRANLTIGRAFRLGAITALGARSGGLDMSSFGHAGKVSFHFAEDPPPAPWLPVHQLVGYPAGTTTVTLLPAEAPRQIMQRSDPQPERVLATVTACLRDPSQNGTGRGTYWIVVLGPEHTRFLIDGGWSQAHVRARLAADSRIRVEELDAAGSLGSRKGAVPDADGMLVTVEPDDILLVTAGGSGAGWSAAIPCWTVTAHVKPMSAPVRLVGTPIAEPDLATVTTKYGP